MGDFPKDDETIVTIRIGPETTPEEYKRVFQVQKGAIRRASGYFKAQLASNPLSKEFDVDYDPDIFSIALSFIKRQELDYVHDLDTLLSMDAAADFFAIDELKIACVEKMVSSVNLQTVWKIYNTNYAPVIEKCEWLLKTRTQLLLAHPEFLTVNILTLIRFLKFDEMNIDSEARLFDACRKYATKKYLLDARKVFRKLIMPHLRILTLEAYERVYHEDLLTTAESLFLTYRNGYSPYKYPVPPSLHYDPNETKRRRFAEDVRVLVVEPDKDIYDAFDSVWEGDYVESERYAVDKFVLSFETKKPVLMQRIEFFCPLRVSQDRHDAFMYRRDVGGIPVPKFLVETKLKVLDSVHDVQPEDMFMNQPGTVKLNVVVPEPARVSIEVEFRGIWAFHKFDKSQAAVFACSDPCIQEVLENVTLKHLHDGEEPEKEFNTTVFKSVYMKLI